MWRKAFMWKCADLQMLLTRWLNDSVLPMTTQRLFTLGLSDVLIWTVSTVSMCDWWSNLKIKRSKVKVTADENVEIVYAYFRERLIDLQQTNSKLVFGPCYTHRQPYFTSENAQFLRYLFLIMFFANSWITERHFLILLGTPILVL